MSTAELRIAEIPDLEIDPITVDIIENALRHARFEMDAVLFRSAMSPVIREQHDEFPMLTDPQGRMVVGQFGAYISEMMAEWDRGVYPGDVILTSDPYKCSASISHTNDWLVLVPIFFEDELVGWSSQFGHQMDAGGRLPGSLPTGAKTIFEEGLIIPPLKVVERGVVQEEILRLILNNVRLPDMNRADLFAIIAACHAGERRVIGLCERFGKDVYLATLQALLDRTHEAMRKLIVAAIPEEPQTFEDYIDDDGLGNGPYRMRLTIWREGDHAWFDWSGTDPQAIGPVNFYLSEGMFKMFIGVYLIMVNDPQILFNDGFYPLLHVVMPEGCLLQPALPGRARVPHARADAPVRRPRRRAVQAGAGAQHRGRLRHLAVHALQRLGLRAGTSSTRWRSSTAGSRGARSATGWTGTRGGRCSRTSPPSTSRPTTPCGSTATRPSPTPAARAAPRRQRGREALRVPRAGRRLDPRRPLAHPPVGRAGRRAGRALDQAPAPRRRHGGGAARQVRRDRGAARRHARSTARPGGGGWKDRLDRPRRGGGARRGLRAGVAREGAERATGSCSTTRARRRGGHRGRARAAARERGERRPFDFGPSLADTLARCEEETGLPAPQPRAAAALVAGRVARGGARARPRGVGAAGWRPGTGTRPAWPGFGGAAGFPRRPAVLVVDLVHGFTDPASPLGADLDDVVAATRRVIDAAREAGVPVVFTTVCYDAAAERAAAVFLRKVPALAALRPGTRDVEVDPRLGREDGRPAAGQGVRVGVLRHAAERAAGRGRRDGAIVCGATTSGCVRATVVDALQHGYAPIVAREAVGDRSQAAHDASLFDVEQKYGDVLGVEEVVGALRALRSVA